MVKNPPASVGDVGLTPRSGKSPGEGHSNPLQYSYLENPMARGAQGAIVRGVSESDTTEQLSTLSLTHTHTRNCLHNISP